LFLLAFAAAVVTANAYYIHPIIALVAKDFGVSPSEIGLVPALNQIALAAGIFGNSRPSSQPASSLAYVSWRSPPVSGSLWPAPPFSASPP
jgi:hypothetical protein